MALLPGFFLPMKEAALEPHRNHLPLSGSRPGTVWFRGVSVRRCPLVSSCMLSMYVSCSLTRDAAMPLKSSSQGSSRCLLIAVMFTNGSARFGSFVTRYTTGSHLSVVEYLENFRCCFHRRSLLFLFVVTNRLRLYALCERDPRTPETV